MADQRPPISLAELNKRVSEAVIHNIASFVDKEKIARAFLTAKDICGDSDMVTSHLETASEIIGEAVHDEVESKWLTSKVTEVLKDAGFTNPPPAAAEASNVDEQRIEEPVAAAIEATMADPRPRPSLVMDVTALREQILGSFPHRFKSCTSIH